MSEFAILKPVEELTESERVAILVDAGVPIKSVTMTETGVRIEWPPAAISIERGEYVVVWKRR